MNLRVIVKKDTWGAVFLLQVTPRYQRGHLTITFTEGDHLASILRHDSASACGEEGLLLLARFRWIYIVCFIGSMFHI